MEALRRARFAWAVLVLLAGLGAAALQLYARMPGFAAAALWCAGWLTLPLYMHWAPIAKLAAVWFLGAVPVVVLLSEPRVQVDAAVMLTIGGAVALIIVWVIGGLFTGSRTTKRTP